MRTAIRMDDITPDMNFAKFNKVKAILDKAGLTPLIGVVPFNEDENLAVDNPYEDFGELLRSLVDKGWVIALHGYNHLYTTNNKGVFPINEFSEFAGVSLDKQNQMIAQGIAKLREWGVEPVAFMAPGHTFDTNTMKALKTNGITRITDGFGNRPYVRNGITFYPISKKRSECISSREGYSTYVLHTNTMSNQAIDLFEKLIEENRTNFISYNEYMETEAIKRSVFGNIKEYSLALAKHYLISRRASKGTVIHND